MKIFFWIIHRFGFPYVDFDKIERDEGIGELFSKIFIGLHDRLPLGYSLELSLLKEEGRLDIQIYDEDGEQVFVANVDMTEVAETMGADPKTNLLLRIMGAVEFAEKTAPRCHAKALGLDFEEDSAEFVEQVLGESNIPKRVKVEGKGGE